MLRHTLTLLLLSMLSWTLKAQPGGGCGTVLDSATVAFLDQFESQIQQQIHALASNRSAEEFSSSIPVRFHFVRQTNGTGGQAHNTLSLLSTLDQRFSGSGLTFSQCGPISYIDNSALFNYTTAQEGVLRAAAYTPGVVNVYLVNSCIHGNDSLNGYTYPPNLNKPDLIVMKYEAAPTSTFAHEMGHFFGLYHTHGKTNCGPMTDELVNGCNCQTAGDNVCDTPADPGLAGVNCLVSPVINCTYSDFILRDANQHVFAPQVSNLMSYAPSNCRTQFTTGQKNRMLAQYQLYRTYLSCSTACSEPTLSVSTITDRTAQVSWNSASDIQLRELEIRTVNGSWTPVFITPSRDNFSTTLRNLQPGTGYVCRLRTVCENGVSNWKESGTFTTLGTCNTPAGLSTTVNTQSVTFSWAPVAGVLSYTIEIRPAGAQYWNKTVTTGGTSYTFPYADPDHISINQGLGTNTPFKWRIRTNCSGGLASAWSSPVLFTTASAACNSPRPSDLEIISLSTNSVTVRCNRPAHRYQFRKVQLGGGDPGTQMNSSTSNTNTFSVEPCRVYEVQCLVQCQNGGPSSFYSASLFFTTPGCNTSSCNPPTGLSASNVTHNSVTLQWSHPGGVGYPYTLQWRSTGLDWSDVSGGVSGTSVTLRHLKPNTFFEFRMRSNCGNNVSAWTPSVSITTTPMPCNPPRALRVILEPGGAALIWSEPHGGASTYTAEYSLNGGPWNPGTISGTTRYVSLPPSTPVAWRVRSNCGIGQSSAWRTGPTFNSLPQASLAVSPGTHQVGANATGATISVSSTINWSATVSSGGSWLRICQNTTTMTGIGNGSISASFSANSSPTPRTATVTVTGGGFTHQVTITQAGNSNPNCSNDNEPANNSMSTAPSIPLGADKQSQIGSNSDTDFWKFTLNSSQSTTITLTTLPADYDLALFNSSGAQLAASTNGGTSNETITINLAAGTYFARVIGYNGVFSTSQCYTLRVNTQTVSLDLSPATQNVGSGAGTASLSVTSNVSWTATDNASWLSLSPGSGTGNGAITASFSANTTSAARTATVTVTGGGFTRTATITQAGVVAACNPPGNPNTVSITQNTATLQWSSAPGATAYQVQFLLSNAWTNVGAPTTFLSMDIYGLLPGTSYSWRVITICAGNQQSAPSASVTFTAMPAAANCPGGVQSPAFALNPTGSWQYQSLPGGGRYMVVNVQSGVRYVFSGCPSDGAGIPFDGQLSIRNMSDQLISYSDDVCGLAPRIIWHASFTGQVRVLLTKYNCQAENGNSTLAYRIDNNFTGEDTEERDATPAYVALPAPDVSVLTEWVDTDANEEGALLLTASPNPAKDQFLVHCTYAGETAGARLRVMDLSGRLYQEDNVTLVHGTNTWMVTVNNWPPNLYLLHLHTNEGRSAIHKVLIVP